MRRVRVLTAALFAYIGTDEEMEAFSATTGVLLFSTTLGNWSPPAVLDGRVFTGSTQGFVRAFGLR